MFDTPIGKVSIVPKGEYNSSNPYERLDLVYYGGSGYIVLRDVVGVTPTDGEDYMLLTKGGDKGDKGDQGDKGEKGDTGEQGIQGDQGIQGETGVGIQKIERTSGTGAAGTVDTYTITLTNGNTTTFQVTNGADGEGSGDMLKSVYDKNNKATDVYAYTDTAVSGKQDKITGTAGQIVGFDASGNPVAQEAPATGVTSFNGRTGAIVPQEGDYTASQVGALPSDGVASSANKLANKAKIDGVEFDGTSNVTHFGEAQSVDDTSEITVEIPGIVLENGVKITVNFLGIASRNRPQLNVNGTGALYIEIFDPATLSYMKLDNTDPLKGIFNLVYEKTWATEAWLLELPFSSYSALTLLYRPSISVDLSSNAKSVFVGDADITPGVTGNLSISNGGTGANTSSVGLFNLINGTESLTTIANDDYIGVVDASATTGKKILFSDLKSAIGSTSSGGSSGINRLTFNLAKTSWITDNYDQYNFSMKVKDSTNTFTDDSKIISVREESGSVYLFAEFMKCGVEVISQNRNMMLFACETKPTNNLTAAVYFI